MTNHLESKEDVFVFKRFVVKSLMKTDRYTKIILTIIAVALIVNIIKPIVTTRTAQASNGNGKFASLVIYQDGSFFDTATGYVWHYDSGRFMYCQKLVELGRNMVSCSQ